MACRRHEARAGALHHDLRLAVADLGWMYTLFFVLLGIVRGDVGRLARARRAAQGGRRVGAVLVRRPADLGAIGVYTHQLWMLWLGSGVIGGIGLGLGYISPVSTLIKWFPDRRGMATGMAIMGFGGGAMIGAPLAESADELISDADIGRRLADLRRDGGDLFRLHAVRRLRLSPAAGRLEARGLDAAANGAMR